MRLFELDMDEILSAWKNARSSMGKREYGDDHLKRYNLVDVVEELLDAIIILERLLDRQVKSGVITEEFVDEVCTVIYQIEVAVELCNYLDRMLEDKVVTDELGGDRVWFD